MPTKTTSPVWTQEHEEFLREAAGTIPARDIASRLGRTENAVRMKASTSGLSLTLSDRTRMGGARSGRGAGGSEWSSEEEATLRSMAGNSPTAEIAKTFNRSEKDIQRKAAKMKLSLTNQDSAQGSEGKAHKGGAAGKESSAVRSTLAREGTDSGRVSWEAADEAELRQFAGVVPVEEISKRMNRTVKAIQRKAAKMGISLATERAPRERSESAAVATPAPAPAQAQAPAPAKRGPGRPRTRPEPAARPAGAKRPGRPRTRPVEPAAPVAVAPTPATPSRRVEAHAAAPAGTAGIAPHPVSIMKFLRLLDEERARLGLATDASDEQKWDAANQAFTRALSR